jgi:hypothetical protein
MIEVGMSQEHIIDAGGIKAEWLLILFVQLAATLMHAAVDQDFLARALDHMA